MISRQRLKNFLPVTRARALRRLPLLSANSPPSPVCDLASNGNEARNYAFASHGSVNGYDEISWRCECYGSPIGPGFNCLGGVEPPASAGATMAVNEGCCAGATGLFPGMRKYNVTTHCCSAVTNPPVTDPITAPSCSTGGWCTFCPYGNLDTRTFQSTHGTLAQCNAAMSSLGGSGHSCNQCRQVGPGPNGPNGIVYRLWRNTGVPQQCAPLSPSDQRLKENINFVGRDNGFNIYEFNYIGNSKVYRGVMAQEVMMTRPDAVVDGGGFHTVNYNLLGLDFYKVK